jgi:hypothetical protein
MTMKRLLLIFAATAFAASPSSAGAKVSARTPAALQCRHADQVIPKRIRFARGRTTTVIKDTVRLCTSHEYTLRASAGQTMSVHLATGKKTSFTVQSPSGTIEDADGVKDWSGELSEAGDYVIVIGTDATAAYTLEVTIR